MKTKQSTDFLNRMTARVISMNSSRQHKHSRRIPLNSSIDAIDAWTTIKNLSKRLEESLDLITNPEAFREEIYALSRKLQDFADRTAYAETLSSSCALDSAKKDPSAEVANIYSDLKKRVQKLLEDKVPKSNPTLKKMQDKIKELEKTYSAKKLQVALNSSLGEDEFEETEGWELIAVKSVPDSDGFMTEYAWWHRNSDEMNAMIFGDTDIYNPTNTHWDFETEDDDIAEEWFRLYEGFSEDDEEEDLNSSVATSDGDEFYAIIDGGRILKLEKSGGKWYEYPYYPEERVEPSASYMGYLTPNDIMEWLQKDYGNVSIADYDEVHRAINSMSDEETDEDGILAEYYFVGDNTAARVSLVEYPSGKTVWEGWVYQMISGVDYDKPRLEHRQFESTVYSFADMLKELQDISGDSTLIEANEEAFNSFIKERSRK